MLNALLDQGQFGASSEFLTADSDFGNSNYPRVQDVVCRDLRSIHEVIEQQFRNIGYVRDEDAVPKAKAECITLKRDTSAVNCRWRGCSAVFGRSDRLLDVVRFCVLQTTQMDLCDYSITCFGARWRVSDAWREELHKDARDNLIEDARLALGRATDLLKGGVR